MHDMINDQGNAGGNHNDMSFHSHRDCSNQKTSVGENVEKWEPSCPPGGSPRWYKGFGSLSGLM